MIKRYFAPTPKNMRILGDTLLAVSTMLMTHQLAAGNQTIGIISMVAGVVGKFLTNFTKDRIGGRPIGTPPRPGDNNTE